MTDRARWAIVTGILFALLAIVVWLVVADAPIVKFLVRLYQDKKFLKDTVRSWGWMARARAGWPAAAPGPGAASART